MATADRLGIELVKPLGPGVWKARTLTGVEAISQTYRFELEMVVEAGQEVAFGDVLGQPATIRLGGSGPPRLIHGLVCQLAVGSALFVGDTVASTIPYRVVVVPRLWKLGLKRNRTSFRNASSLDIAKQLLSGLDLVVNLPKEPKKRAYVVQDGETDLAFLQRLLAEDGIFFFFRQTQDREQLVLADGNTAFVELAGGNASDPSRLPFRRRESYDTERPQQVFSWQLEQRLTAGSVAAGDYHFQNADQNLTVTSSLAEPVTVGTESYEFKNAVNKPIEHYTFPGKYAGWLDGIAADKSEKPVDASMVRDRGKEVIDRTAERLASGALRGLGESNCFQLTSGGKFFLEHPSDGDWFAVLRVEHQAVPEDTEMGFASAPVYRNRFEAAPIKVAYRPPELPAPSVGGLQTALVTGPAKTDVLSEKYGRVQLQFHWDRKARKGLTNQSNLTLRASNYWAGPGAASPSVPPWARVTQGWAGSGYGALITPRLGHEVVVGFLSGDPACPAVLNSGYNSVTGTPLPMPEAAKFFAHKTRTVGADDTNHFSALGIEDTKGAEHVQLQSQNDLLFSTENDHLLHIHGHLRKRANKGSLLTVGSNPLKGLTSGGGGGGDSFGKWTVGTVSASLSYGFNIVYGEYAKAVGLLYGGLAIGTKTDIYVSPFYGLVGASALFPVRLEYLMTTKSDFVLGTRSSITFEKKPDDIDLSDKPIVQYLSRSLAVLATVEFLALGICGAPFTSLNVMNVAMDVGAVLVLAAFACLWVCIWVVLLTKLTLISQARMDQILGGLGKAGLGIFIAFCVAAGIIFVAMVSVIAVALATGNVPSWLFS